MSEIKIEPCPMPDCEGECAIEVDVDMARPYWVHCWNCSYQSGNYSSEFEAVAGHKQLCKDVKLGKAAEKVCENPPEAYKLVEALSIDDCTEYVKGFKAANGFWFDRLRSPVEDTELRGKQSDGEGERWRRYVPATK